jgi:hypothetical protein
MSPQSAWRILQAEGARLRLEEGPLIESVFDAGEEPPDIVAPALVMVEADGTYIKRSVRTPTASRSRPASSTAARSAREAGAIAAGCSWTRAATPSPPTPTRLAKPLLRKASGPSDYITPGGCPGCHYGLDEFGQTFRGWFPGAVQQADHYHVAARLWQLCSGNSEFYRRLKKATVENPHAVATSCAEDSWATTRTGRSSSPAISTP